MQGMGKIQGRGVGPKGRAAEGNVRGKTGTLHHCGFHHCRFVLRAVSSQGSSQNAGGCVRSEETTDLGVGNYRRIVEIHRKKPGNRKASLSVPEKSKRREGPVDC